MRARLLIWIALTGLLPAVVGAEGGEKSLRGSRASMARQNAIARAADYSFLRTPAQVVKLVEAGALVAVPGNENYRSVDVSFPYARPEIRLFIERLSEEYHNACGEPLVVTSLTRPLTRQPRNAHKLSVHPAGMAVDLRVSSRGACRNFLEETLLSLEAEDLLDVTREYRPPHFHVAVFPTAYRTHVTTLLDAELAQQEEAARLAAAAVVPAPEPPVTRASLFSLSAPVATLLPVLFAVLLGVLGYAFRRGRSRQ